MKKSEQLEKLKPTELRDKLITVTIGGMKDQVDIAEKAQTFAEYIRRALPEVIVLEVTPTTTTAALNSVSGIIKLRLANGLEQEVFGKVHIESNTLSVNPSGAKGEYENSQLLIDAGWPALKPIAIGQNPDYPMLLYPVVKDRPLFNVLEDSYTTGKVKITPDEIESLGRYNSEIGKKEVESMRVGTVDEAVSAPVQTLFLKRFEEKGRIDQWYKDETLFKLPGIDQPLSWKELLDIKWEINGDPYESTLRDLINQARSSLIFKDEERTFMIVSHGDDHAGNVRLTNPPTVFDPAFAGWNPAALELKALAHTGFLPLAAMYYFPKGLKFVYRREGNVLVVQNNMLELPGYAIQEELARQIIDFRVVPLLDAIRKRGGNLERETQRIRNGLAGCALLTVNIAELLKQGDEKACGLLPMAIMFNELRGLPMLDYLRKKI